MIHLEECLPRDRDLKLFPKKLLEELLELVEQTILKAQTLLPVAPKREAQE
jgi:hypothetical protein